MKVADGTRLRDVNLLRQRPRAAPPLLCQAAWSWTMLVRATSADKEKRSPEPAIGDASIVSPPCSTAVTHGGVRQRTQ